MKKDQELWYELIVQDSSSLSGAAVAAFLGFVAEVIDTNKMVIDDVDGANVKLLKEKYAARCVSVEEVIPIIEHVVQFDWGNFLFFKGGVTIPEKNQSYADFVSETTATVRAVDSSDIYIYTRDSKLVQAVRDRFRNVEFKKRALVDFTFPD